MSITEERLAEIKRKILQAVERDIDIILREEFALNNTDASSLVKRFVEEECVLSYGEEISSSDLYHAYENWIIRNNLGLISHIKFSQEIERQRYPGIMRIRRREGSYWKGIGLRTRLEE